MPRRILITDRIAVCERVHTSSALRNPSPAGWLSPRSFVGHLRHPGGDEPAIQPIETGIARTQDVGEGAEVAVLVGDGDVGRVGRLEGGG